MDQIPVPCDEVDRLDSMESVKERMRGMLETYDREMSAVATKYGGKRASMAQMWDESWAVRNVNELLLGNLISIQVMFQAAMEKYFQASTKSAERAAQLQQKFLESQDNDDYFKYQDVKRRQTEDEAVYRDAVLQLGRFAKDLFSEHRKAEEASKTRYDVSIINILFATFIAILRQEIPQPDKISRISEKLEQAYEATLGQKENNSSAG